MSENNELTLRLTKARQQLLEAQRRVDELEAQLLNGQPELLRAQTIKEFNQPHEKAALKRYMQWVEVVRAIDTGFIQGSSVEAWVKTFLSHIRQLFLCQRVHLILIDEDSGRTHVFAVDLDENSESIHAVRDPISPSFFDGYDARHIKVTDDFRGLRDTLPRAQNLEHEGLVCALSVVLMAQERPLGVLELLADAPGYFTLEHQEMAAELGNHLATAIRQMQLSDESAHHAATPEQNAAERTADLQAALGRVEAILNNSPDAIVLAHSDLGIQQANSTFGTLFGSERDEYFGKSLLTLVSADDANRLTNVFHMVTVQDRQQAEVRGIRKDGTHFDAEFNIAIVKDDSLVCIVRDITERKRQMRQLLYHASIQESISDAVFVMDMDFTIQSWNKAAELIYGWTADEVIGTHADKILRTEFTQVEHQTSFQQLTVQGWLELEVIQRHKDNHKLYIWSSFTLIKDDFGQPFSIVAVNHDISERKARERELLYHASIQESVSDAVIATDMDFRIQSWNRAAEMIYGWSAAEAIGKSVEDVLKTSYESEADHARILHDFLESGAWQGEVIQHHRNGDAIHILGSVNLFKDEKGQPIGVVAVNRDITERKRIQVALQKSSAEIHDLYNNAPCGYHSIDKDGLVVQMNDTELKWLGYTREEVVGKLKVMSLFTPESVLSFERSFPVFAERGWVSDLELDMVRKDGSTIHILLNATAIYDDDGHYLKSRSTLFDITELRQTQQSIAESEMRYRLLAENVTDVIVRVDPRGIRTFISPSCYALLGFEPDELTGVMASDIVNPEDVEKSNARLLQAIEAAEPSFSITQRVRHKQGHYIWVEGTNSIVREPSTGNVTGFIGVYRDITERKHAEEALQIKSEEDRQFQIYLKALHEVVIELTAIDDLDVFYRRTVELGRERLGFERLAMFLYDEQDGSATGTYGTDTDGQLVAEPDVRFKPDPDGPMQRSLGRTERFYLNEQTTLYNDEKPVGHGWNAAAVLWNGTRSLGWFVADNLLNNAPVSKSQLDILGLYALSVGTLLAQKQTQMALRESESLYRLLAENISDLIMRSTMASECLYISPSVQNLLGYAPEELIGRQTFEFVHPDDQIILWEAYASALERHEVIKPHEYRARHKAGHYVWLETLGKPLYGEGSDEVLGVITSSRDITERKRSREALRQSEQMLFNVLENIPVRIFWKDRHSVYQGSNTRHAQAVGLESREEVVGKTDYDFFSERAAEWESGDREVMETGVPRLNVEELFVEWDGSKSWLRSNKVPLRSSAGEVTGVLMTIEDITEHKQSEIALRESEEKFRLLMEAAPVAIVITNTMGQIALVNHQAEEIFGYAADELQGQPVELLVPINARERHSHHMTGYMHAPHVRGKGSGLDLSARRKDNTEFPVEIELSYVKTKDGLMVMSFITDITERQRVAAELERQRSFLRNVIDVSPSMIFVKDYDSRFVLANPKTAQMYSTTVEALIGKTDADFDPVPKEVDDFLEADQRVIASGEPLFIEEPITNTLGETHWLQTTKVPIVSADGNSKYVLGVSTDITERIRSEAALKESEGKYRSLIETMRGGLVMFDLDNKITYINDRFCEILGYSPEEVLGTRAVDYVDPSNIPILVSHVSRRQDLESSTYELLFRHKDGSPVHLLVSGSPLLDLQGKFNGSFAVVTDISAQKQAEAALEMALGKEKELSELKTRFVSMASHEFRTPLATILALTETLSAYRHRLSDDQIDQRFDKIKDQVGHLKDIMEDVLLLARMQARRVDFSPVRLDLEDLCRSVLDEFQSHSDFTHQIEYSGSDTVRQVVLDKKLMRQIISNVVSNAIKYSPPFSCVRVSLEYDSGAVVLTVSDEGIGIPEADLPHLFEPFHRAANVGTVSGTGLGLVITKELVELQGGTISVNSQVDVGTTFTVLIPSPSAGDPNSD